MFPASGMKSLLGLILLMDIGISFRVESHAASRARENLGLLSILLTEG
jgi:hypothetical protein